MESRSTTTTKRMPVDLGPGFQTVAEGDYHPTLTFIFFLILVVL